MLGGTQWRKSRGFWLEMAGCFHCLIFIFNLNFNISTILTSKLQTFAYVWRLDSWLSLGIYISWVESSVNKPILLNRVLFLHRVGGKYIYKRNCVFIRFSIFQTYPENIWRLSGGSRISQTGGRQPLSLGQNPIIWEDSHTYITYVFAKCK